MTAVSDGAIVSMVWRAFLTFHANHMKGEQMEDTGPADAGADEWLELRLQWSDTAGDLEDALEAVVFEFDAELDEESGTLPQTRPVLGALQLRLAAMTRLTGRLIAWYNMQDAEA
eukprot:607339-Lingulodinium_polyedra.AAC.1